MMSSLLLLFVLINICKLSTATSTTLSHTAADDKPTTQLPWSAFGIIFGVTVGLSFSGLFYWFHATYFLFRRYKYGIKGKATIICKEITEYTAQKQKTEKYHIKYMYNDNRPEITNKYITYLVATISDVYIPIEIQQIISEYVQNAFIFWWGPYQIDCTVSETFYHEHYIGSKIDITYDPIYPKNCDLYLEPIWCSFWYWFRWFGGLLLSLTGSIFAWFVVIPINRASDHYEELIIMTISIGVSILIVLICCTCYVKGTGCFRSRVKGKVQCVETDDDRKIHQIMNAKELLYDQCKETDTMRFEHIMEVSVSWSI